MALQIIRNISYKCINGEFHQYLDNASKIPHENFEIAPEELIFVLLLQEW